MNKKKPINVNVELRNIQASTLKLSEALFGKDDPIYLQCLKEIKSTQGLIDTNKSISHNQHKDKSLSKVDIKSTVLNY